MKHRLFILLLAAAPLFACQSTAIPASRSFDVSKVVAADHKLLAGHYNDLNPDCSAIAGLVIRSTKEPSHGRLAIAPGPGYSTYSKNHAAFHCNDRPSQGINVTYTPNSGYVGADDFSISAIFGNGNENTVHYALSVK